MDNLKPSQLALIGGGALVLISTFLDWFSVGEAGLSFGYSGWETGSFGLLGIFVAVVKLDQLARIELATAFWAYLALIVIVAAGTDALDSRKIWDNVRLVGERKGKADRSSGRA